jgi:hypothetical protein
MEQGYQNAQQPAQNAAYGGAPAAAAAPQTHKVKAGDIVFFPVDQKGNTNAPWCRGTVKIQVSMPDGQVMEITRDVCLFPQKISQNGKAYWSGLVEEVRQGPAPQQQPQQPVQQPYQNQPTGQPAQQPMQQPYQNQPMQAPAPAYMAPTPQPTAPAQMVPQAIPAGYVANIDPTTGVDPATGLPF